MSDELKINLSVLDKVPNQHPTDDGNQRRVSQSDSLVESAVVLSDAQNSLASGVESRHARTFAPESLTTSSESRNDFSESSASPSQNLQQERTGETLSGEVKDQQVGDSVRQLAMKSCADEHHQSGYPVRTPDSDTASPSQTISERRDIKCKPVIHRAVNSAASNVQPADAAFTQSEIAPALAREKQPSLRPSPISGVTPPIATRWKKGESGNPGGRPKHVSRAYIKHLETVVDEETGETNADKIAQAQIKKATLVFDPGSTAAAREIRQATEGDDEANKGGGFNIGSLNVAILNQIQRAATGE